MRIVSAETAQLVSLPAGLRYYAGSQRHHTARISSSNPCKYERLIRFCAFTALQGAFCVSERDGIRDLLLNRRLIKAFKIAIVAKMVFELCGFRQLCNGCLILF